MAVIGSVGSLDRHQALKATNRRAIMDAALGLAQEFGPAGFSADQLAARADVSKRTIFNHFGSIEDAVYAALSHIMASAVDDLIEALRVPDGETFGDGADVARAFEDCAAALTTIDMPGVLAHLTAIIGTHDQVNPGAALWIDGVLRTVTPQLTQAVERRIPKSSPVIRAMLVQSVIAAVGVAYVQWCIEAGAKTNAEGRAAWTRLLEAALEPVRHGFAPDPR